MRRTCALSGRSSPKWALEHRSFVVYMMIAAAIAGLGAFYRLGRDEDPPFVIKTMVVQAAWPGATLDDTLLQVTDRLERTLQETLSLDFLRSFTSPGKATIFVNLKGETTARQIPDIWYQVRKSIAICAIRCLRASSAPGSTTSSAMSSGSLGRCRAAGSDHILVKGALFLAAGVAGTTKARLWRVLLPAAVLALGLGGLPLTGGALAKLAVKVQLGDGVVGTLATLSAAGSTLLMLHFLYRLMQTATRESELAVPAGLTLSWLGMAFGAVVVPWVLYPLAGSGTSFDALAPGTLWAALWPVLLGAVLAVGLWRWGRLLPRVPEGDIVVAGEAAARATVTWGEAMERADGYLRQWPLAGLSLLTLAIILGAAMLAWR